MFFQIHYYRLSIHRDHPQCIRHPIPKFLPSHSLFREEEPRQGVNNLANFLHSACLVLIVPSQQCRRHHTQPMRHNQNIHVRINQGEGTQL